mmetsp:Transcript_76727/g.121171  ORF Transcript_76727/g.121171 Transcript_76727/m.121171 type:complete len:457 (-) Transcript_76727:54-1424(-)
MAAYSFHQMLPVRRASAERMGICYWMVGVSILQLANAAPLLSKNIRKSSSFLQVHDDPHPFRCSLPTSKCVSFGSKCEKSEDCYSYHCYNGKCGYARECRDDGALCHTHASHTCCSGTCEAVTQLRDCHRLLKGSGSPALDQGVNFNRQCQQLGVCKAFADPNPSKLLSTPWAVPASDLASKYRQLAHITFKEGVQVRADLFIARRSGQTYDQIQPDSMKPGGIRDAGVVVFTDDSKVDPTLGASYKEGMTTYCVAPILREGAGGGYFAVGINCCGDPPNTEFNFNCGDALKENVKSGLVIGAGSEKYMQAQQIIESKSGYKIHDKTKGITTLQPMFVRILKDYAAEAQKPQVGYSYVAQGPITHCVAPVMDPTNPKQIDAEFWAAGTDCCDTKTGFHCGDVDKVGSRSGETLVDSTGDLRQAVTMAELRYGIKAPQVPMYMSWKAEILVPKPVKP